MCDKCFRPNKALLLFLLLSQYKYRLLSTTVKLDAGNRIFLKQVCLIVFLIFFCVLFPTQKSSAFVGQSGLMNFTLSARGDGCNVKEKRATLQLDDKKVFSAVVEISNNEFILKKVK